MYEETITILTKLTQSIAVSGNEKNISRLLQDYISPLSDELIYDNLGSLFGVKKSKNLDAPNVMVSGFLDESGFIVKELLDDGQIKGLQIGEHQSNSLIGSKITILTNNGKHIPGIITSYKKDEVILECGFTSKDQASQSNIDYGNSVAYANESFLSDNNSHFYGKALDRSYGLLQVIHLLNELKDKDLPFNLYVGGTVLNQVGNRGAQTATNLVKPDLAITFNTLEADSDVTKDEKQGILGKGVLVTYYDRSILPNRKLTNDFKQSCLNQDIPFQHYYSLNGSDAGWIHKLRVGSPTLLLNIPAKNLHTNLSIIHLSDLENSLKAATHFISNLTNEDILSFKQENR